MLAGMRSAAIIGMLLLAMAGRAQDADLLVRGQPVGDPEVLSGRWVARDGRGGWVQLEMRLSAVLPLEGSLKDGPFLLSDVQVGVCHGTTLALRLGQCNYFTNDPAAGVRLGREFLQIHLAAGGYSPPVDVDLIRTGEVWAGLLRRGDWSGQVRLVRGGNGGFTGTWRRKDGRDCLHVNDTADGLVASLDQLQDPLRIRYANGLTPQPLFETFGWFVGAERNPLGFLRFEIGGEDEGAAGGMSRTIQVRPLGPLRGRRSALVLTGMRSGDGRSSEPDWVRIRSGTCRLR